MNKRALQLGIIYSLTVILFKLIILLGGYTLSTFGFYYSNLVSILLIFPFFFIVIYQSREKDFGGVISGRDSVRLCLTILAISVIFISIYNYIEFDWKYKEIAVTYYHSDEYLDMLKKQQQQYPDKIKTEDFPRIIEEQIRDLSAFKATTGKLIPMMFFGLSGAFLISMMLKKNKAA